ncbi:DUF4192 family protein [Corynebacterium nasicanis]|uniref:DUF4192 family protein n=1 Tax=Corynebacterium nasicanis TaxID=1448267 RepID=A0ABW1QB01_9CORY
MSAPAPVPHAPLTDPGQLVANLPGILGFYPQGSVIAMILTHQQDQRYELGPTLRVDLEDVEHLVEIMPGMVEPTDIALVIIVSEDQTATDQALSTITGQVDHLVEGVWACAQIEEGEPLHLLHGEVIPSQWRGATIPAIHAATATRDILHRGGHVALDRSEAHQRYQPVLLPSDQRQALETAVEAVDDRLDAIRDTAEGEIQSLIAQLRAGLEETPAGTTPQTVDADLLALACALLSANDLDIRDLVLGEVIDRPKSGQVLTHAVGVYGPDTLTRVTGLTAHALAVMATGGPRQQAQAALAVAREAAPLHGLTTLIHGAVVSGAEPAHIVDCVMSGVQILRARYGIAG